MNEVKVFQFRENEVRVVDINGEPWFVAKDVAEVLGYSETNRMTARLDDDEKSKIKSAIAETQALFNALMVEYFEE